MTRRFNEALVGAADLHAQQPRKGSDTPYIAHLLGVTSIALEHGADEDEAIAALLHDAIEDAPKELGAAWVRQWIQFRFGGRVLEIVNGCTDADQFPKPPWRHRKEEYIRSIEDESASVLLVSASDKLHNARAILMDFRTFGGDLWTRFNTDAGRDGVISYYRGLVNAFRQRCNALAVPQQLRLVPLISELDRVVTSIESEVGFTGHWPMR